MQLLADIWHIVCSFGNVLLYNPPSLPGWATWVTFMIRIVVSFVVLRRNIAPFLLAKISRRIRARSISMRSIKGLYFRSSGRTWKVERIGWSLHPWAESRMSVKIEGLRVEIGMGKTSTADAHKTAHQSLSVTQSLGSRLANVWRHMASGLMEWLSNWTLLEWMRTLAFSVLIVAAQLFIRGLSVLAENVDIELDSVTFSFKELCGAQIKFRGISLSSKIDFSQTSKEDSAPTLYSKKKKISTVDNKATPKQWNAMLRGGADRFWERTWGQMEGSASFEMTIRQITGHTCSGPTTCLFCQDLSLNGEHTSGSSKRNGRIDPTLPPDVFLRVSKALQISVSLHFNPRNQTIKRHSLDCLLDIPVIEISADRILPLVKLMPRNRTPKKLKRLTLKQMFNNRTYSSFIPSSPPPVTSPTSPTSPLMSAFSQMAKKRGSMSFMAPVIQRLREPKTESPIVPLNSLEIRLSSIMIAHCWSTRSNDFGKEGYVLGVDDFNVRLTLSNAKNNPLHRKWLGSRDDLALHDSTYHLTGKIGLFTANRMPRILLEPSLQLIALRHLALDLLIHQWPHKWMTKPQSLAGDPNEPFMACEFSIVGIYVTDRLDDLRTTMDMIALRKDKFAPKSNPSSSSSSSFKVPRIEFRTICDDIQIFLMTNNDVTAHSIPLLILNTSGFTGGLSTYFRHDAIKSDRTTQIVLDSSCHFSLQRTFVRLRLPSLETTESFPELEPLFSMDMVDISAAGTTLCMVGPNDTVEVDLYTHMADVRCITDGINVELWKSECVSALRTVVDLIGMSESVSPPSPSEPLKALRAGLSVHLAIGNLTCVITAPDLNPNCDLELSRGLELSTGLSLQYCCLQTARHAPRARTRLSYAKAREQLGLPEDLMVQALAISNAETDPNDIAALVQVSAWQTTCRAATATRYEYGANEDTAEDKDLVFVPQSIVKALLRRRNQEGSIVDLPCEATCDISVNIPHLRSHLDLLNAYSALLALHTFKRLLPSNPANAVASPRPPTIRSKFRLRVGSTHIFVVFPVQERIFIQILSATVEKNLAVPLKAELKSVAGWGQSAQVLGKYEELLRTRDICIAMNSNKTEISVEAEGLRVSIPHRYILSDLILDINVTLKALRHIHRLTEMEHYRPLPMPSAEGPKHLPVFNVRIHTVTLEAADSPFEAKLGLIWKVGFQAQRVRIERERAFEAKLNAIMASGESRSDPDSGLQTDMRYHFTSKRTTSITDARDRLNMVHSNSWINSISRHKAEICRKEDTILRQLRHASDPVGLHVPIPVSIYTPEKAPPLFRAVFIGLSVSLSPPRFPDGYQGFLADLGRMPHSTLYSLLLPIHLKITLDAAVINIRDYPLPMLNIPLHSDGPSLDFVTDLVLAEEMGPRESVEWLTCLVVPSDSGIIGAKPFSLQVPKTIMPVKSYANPDITFRTNKFTEFTWGVSYNPAVQEVMRVIETLSHPPHDPSPAIGFWDKLRLIFHWRIFATFEGGAQLHFKGSRDPYHIAGVGAGFDFRWKGNVLIKSGYENPENELVQLSSDSMIITIPDHSRYEGNFISELFGSFPERMSSSSAPEIMDYRKICAKFCNGIRWGIGVAFERTCGSECKACQGDSFNRNCRFFDFVPHYDVILRTVTRLDEKVHDSYAGFRSDFIHFSTSLTSPLERHEGSKRNNFHLTPRTFAHFWSWWHLFDGALSLPIRQGSLFPESRAPSKKFGRHLATIKYRINFSTLYIAHVYKVDSGEAWEAGESQCVGVKAYIDHFQADMHQREEETAITKQETNEPAVIRHKPFSAVDVVMTGLDLRALFAVFAEPQKKTIPLNSSTPDSTRFWETLNPIPLSSSWVDEDDFLELDWVPTDKEPDLYLQEAAQCPRFVYFKRSPRTDLSEGDGMERSKTKFGDEDTHLCLMGKEPSAQEVQLEFLSERLAELRRQAQTLNKGSDPSTNRERTSPLSHSNHETRLTAVTQMIALLERYTQHLTHLRASSTTSPREANHNPYDDVYDIPADIELPQELGDFSNVYQVHCPKIHLNNATRDILQKYYLASRARRGFEYHMSARAVKFIRDQALSIRSELPEADTVKRRPRAGSAHAAAQAVRRMLTGDERHKEAPASGKPPNNFTDASPLYGWDQGVSERKAHLCLLLKPQIVLRSGHNTTSALVLAADHVILRNYGILDTLNAEDPVSGYVMQRNYASINSLQVFRPVDGTSTDHLPLEVFLDIRCESRDFDRVVPLTNATLRYDKFNRLRLRNDVTTVAVSTNVDNLDMTDHLLHETDLIMIEVPRFSISADALAFTSMSDIVTDVLLFSDPAHKARMSRLETMLFSYDFTDLRSAAKVVADLQSRIRQLIRLEGAYLRRATDLNDSGQQDLLASKAHILILSQELNLIFDAIRLAQDKADERNQEKKSALRLRVSSSDISWQMLDENRELLAKLAVRGINYSWLSRQDGSTTSLLSVVDLQAFDGSPNALWPEILAKYDDPPTHHMIRRGLFVEIQWSVLAPVGGISIYDHFKVQLHPIRLALETQLGNKLVDYLIPGRRSRREALESEADITEMSPHRRSNSDDLLDMELESKHILSPPHVIIRPPSDPNPSTASHLAALKTRPTASRSFSNLRSAAAESRNQGYYAPGLPKSSSSTALVDQRGSGDSDLVGISRRKSNSTNGAGSKSNKPDGDASEMRQRSNQKTFVHVEIPSVHVLLSVMKGRGFLVRDARLRTHDLEWRNRTLSFEELIGHFIPSDPSLRGWVKVAWQQPIFSVGGVVKELITKTQWGRLGKAPEVDRPIPVRRKTSQQTGASEHGTAHHQAVVPSSGSSLSRETRPFPSSLPEPTPGRSQTRESSRRGEQPRPRSLSRPRVSSLFGRRSGSHKSSLDSIDVPPIPKGPSVAQP